MEVSPPARRHHPKGRDPARDEEPAMKLFSTHHRSTRPARVPARTEVWSPAMTLPAQAHQLRRTA